MFCFKTILTKIASQLKKKSSLKPFNALVAQIDI